MTNNFFNRVADVFDGFKDSQSATPQQPVLPTLDTRPIPPSSALQKSADVLPSVKNWSHPFKAKGNPLAQLVKLSKAAAGYYPLGRNGLWHGGVHFDAGTAGVMDQSSVSCLADGEVVAYRIDGLSPKTVYLINKVSVMKPFSRNFVLVRHRLQPPHIEGSADIPPSLTFYSLYMHLQDWTVYRRDHAIARPKFWPEGRTRRVKATVKDVLPGHPGQQGLNVRNQVQRGKVLALLSRGAEVTVSGEGDYRKLENTNGPDALKSADGSLRGYLSIHFIEAIAGDEYRVKGNHSLNVRAEASASSKVIAELPMGTEVTVSGEGEFRKLERVNQYVHFNSLEGAREPLADSIVVLEQPIAIKAGDLIGHIGQYQDSKAEHPEEKLHLEVFSGDDVDTFIEASRAWAQRLPATGKTWLKLAKGTPVVTHQARFNATQPPTLNAAHTPSDADLWVPKSLLDGLPVEKKIVIPATADRKAYNWYRLDGLLHDSNSQLLDGWVREEIGVTPWVNPWSWEGYETIDNYDTPRQSLASFLRAVGRFNETELGRHGALAEMSDKGPMKSRLYDIIDRNHDGKMTAEELQAAMCLPAHAQSLSHLIIHYESEWHYKPQKWEAVGLVQGEGGGAVDARGILGQLRFQHFHARFQGFAETLFLGFQHVGDVVLRFFQLRIGAAHLDGQVGHQLVEERLRLAQLVAVAQGAADDAAQHIGAAFAAWNDAVDDHEGGGADVVGDHAQRLVFQVGGARFARGSLDQVLEQVDFIVRMHVLQHGGQGAVVAALGAGTLGLVVHLHGDGAAGGLLAVGALARGGGVRGGGVGTHMVADGGVLAPQRLEQIGRQRVAGDVAGQRQRLVQVVQGGVRFRHRRRRRQPVTRCASSNARTRRSTWCRDRKSVV